MLVVDGEVTYKRNAGATHLFIDVATKSDKQCIEVKVAANTTHLTVAWVKHLKKKLRVGDILRIHFFGQEQAYREQGGGRAHAAPDEGSARVVVVIVVLR